MLNLLAINAAAKKQIAIGFANSSGTVRYTVPSGRQCVGQFTGSIGVDSYFNLNGTAVQLGKASAASALTLQSVLLAGTVLSDTSLGNVTFVGVESDA